MGYETIVLDSAGSSPLTLSGNGDTSVYFLQELDLGLAARRPTWIGGAEADGSLLVEDPPYDDPTMTATIQVYPATSTQDAALQALNALTQKLQECSASGPDGLACTYTASDASTTYTFYVKLAEYDGGPTIDVNGWLQYKPQVKLKLTRKPFFYRPEIGTVVDDFSTDTLAGNYSFDVGSGTIAVSGGQLVPSSTAEKRLVRATGGYDSAGGYYDSQVTVKMTTGASASGFSAVILKRIDATDFVMVQQDASNLRIWKCDSGTFTQLGSSAAFTPATTTSYWVRGRIEGNVLTAELWSAAPTATGTPTATTTATLSGGDATKFGQGVVGRDGLRLGPAATDWRYDDFTIEPNVAVSSNPLLTMLLPGVPGDVAAEARLIVTDRANQARRYLEWGLQQRHYQGLGLQVDNGSMVTSGFAGTSTTRSGSYNANVIRGTLTTSPSAVAGTGNLGHIGTFRVRGRVYASSATVYVRLSWQDGSGIFRANDYALASQSGGWSDVDLGTITVTPALSGTQQWSGRIEAYSSTSGDTVDVDYLQLFPAVEGYGKARAAYSYTAGAITGRDDFTGTTAGNALNARAAPVGGTWATSGATTDFTFADGPDTGQESVIRSTSTDASPRFAILGTSTPTDTEVGALLRAASNVDLYQGVIARWTDSNNYLRLRREFLGGGIKGTANNLLTVEKVIAGAVTVLGGSASFTTRVNAWDTMRLVVYASGWGIGTLTTADGNTITVSFNDSALATGGTLTSGKVGILDQAISSGGNRWYENIYTATPATEPTILYGGRRAEVRSDSAIRQDSGGTTYGPMPTYRGAHFFVPPAGTGSRTSRIAIRAVRNDIDATAYNNSSGDNLQAQALLTPRLLLPK